MGIKDFFNEKMNSKEWNKVIKQETNAIERNNMWNSIYRSTK